MVEGIESGAAHIEALYVIAARRWNEPTTNSLVLSQRTWRIVNIP
jgi:hypothetical protein